MKKGLLSLLLATMLALPAVGQPILSRDQISAITHSGQRTRTIERAVYDGNFTHRLASFRTDIDYEINRFTYDWAHRLVAVYMEVVDDYVVIDSLQYNDRSQMTRLSGWQETTYGTFKNVYYIDYTYDAAGNIASRTNYNYLDDEWTLGGVYSYTYNEQNQITGTTLRMGGITYQRVRYNYVDGLLREAIWESYNGYGLSEDTKMTYEYDAAGRQTAENDSVSEDGGNSWSAYKRYTYTYDEVGNMTVYHAYDNSDMETERRVYQYDSNMLLSKTLMPWNPEIDTRPLTYSNYNCYTSEEFWTLDINFVLQHASDYIYTYVDINAGTESALRSDETLTIWPNPATGEVHIDAAEGSTVEIRDMAGRLWMTSPQSQVNVSGLPAGCYVVTVRSEDAVRTERLIVGE